MELQSGTLEDHAFLAWLHERHPPATKNWDDDGPHRGLTLSRLLGDIASRLQHSPRKALLQTVLTAQDHLLVSGNSQLTIGHEMAMLLLNSLKGLILGENLQGNTTALLELLPAQLRDEYRALLSRESVQPLAVTSSGPQDAYPSPGTPPRDDSMFAAAADFDSAPTTVGANGAIPGEFPMESSTDPAPPVDDKELNITSSLLSQDHPLMLVVDMAIEDLATLASLPGGAVAAQAAQVVEHLENIAFTADSCDLAQIAARFREQELRFRQLAEGDDAGETIPWDALVDFLQMERATIAPLLTSPQQPVTPMTTAVAGVITAATPPPPPTAAGGDYSDERLAVLGEELREIEPELALLSGRLAERAGSDLLAPLERYVDLLSRLLEVCDALGMEGLKQVVTFIADNINLLVSLDDERRIVALPLFVSWPAMADHYLHNPADETAVDALIDFMQSHDWPGPLTGLDSRDLFALLTAGPTAASADQEAPARVLDVTAEEISLSFDPDINRELFESFLVEAPELASQFNASISSLHSGGDLLEKLRSAQRMSHTLKGSANLIGIKGIATLAHHTEDILDSLARARRVPPPALQEALARSGDCLEAMVDAVHGLAPPPDDALPVLRNIIGWAIRADHGDFDEAPSADNSLSHPLDTAPETVGKPASDAPAAEANAAEIVSSVRVATTTIDDMFRLVEEVTISQGQIREQVSRLKKLGDILASHEQTLQNKRFNLENVVDVRSIASMQRKSHQQRVANDDFDPLEMDQYDELHSATHSYIEAVADARELNQFVVNNISQLDSLLLRQDRLNKELQQLVGATRLVPVSVIASRLERAVRQACRVTQKQASLEIVGRQFLIDGEILNKLVDPLLHILRNAVDHGIEAPDERLEMGKNPSGTITLEFRHQGNNVVVSTHDDGHGLDYERIAAVAMQKGLLQPGQQASHEQLARYILSPAFTTRDSATQLSGRGIGMDAVQAAVTALKGSLTVGDAEGGGTEFVVRIPTNLVTSHSLIVRCGSERFAIPTTFLQQILPPGSGRTTLYGDTEAYQIGNAFYPLHTLNALLGMDDTEGNENRTVLITAGGGRSAAAIAVDYVLQSAELVVKGLGKYVRHVPGSIGVSVLGDGQVIPVLDLFQLISVDRSSRGSSIVDGQLSQAMVEERGQQRPTVLIVDDSLSVRNTLTQLLEDFGYQPLTARDGVEALEMIRSHPPTIVLTDLEMPRMDGMELVRAVRDNPATQQLPIVMITSRTQAKHRGAAEQAGINAYVTKPFIEEELLDTIGSLVRSHARH